MAYDIRHHRWHMIYNMRGVYPPLSISRMSGICYTTYAVFAYVMASDTDGIYPPFPIFHVHPHILMVHRMSSVYSRHRMCCVDPSVLMAKDIHHALFSPCTPMVNRMPHVDIHTYLWKVIYKERGVCRQLYIYMYRWCTACVAHIQSFPYKMRGVYLLRCAYVSAPTHVHVPMVTACVAHIQSLRWHVTYKMCGVYLLRCVYVHLWEFVDLVTHFMCVLCTHVCPYACVCAAYAV